MNSVKSSAVFAPRRAGIVAVAGIAIAAVGAAFIQTSAAQDRKEEGKEKFRQIATVLQHPRCMNCHTRSEFPRQWDDRHRHAMNVLRGPADHGAPASWQSPELPSQRLGRHSFKRL